MPLLPTTFPVTSHTDYVGPNSVFVAVKGDSFDGRSFISQALAAGAQKIVVDDVQGVCVPREIELDVVKDARVALAALSAEHLGNPADKLSILGITGTAGKTTTAYLVHHMLAEAGINAALLSGVVNRIGGETEPSRFTTPQADYLHMFFSQCVKKGVTHVVMEVSSHAVATERVAGISYAALGFTNLSPEHLDFHATLEEYFATKTAVFSQIKQNGWIVVCPGDKWNERALQVARGLANLSSLTPMEPTDEAMEHTVGDPSCTPDAAQVTGLACAEIPDQAGNDRKVRLSLRTSSGIQVLDVVREDYELQECSSLPGAFNKKNIDLAASLAQSQGVKRTTIQQALTTFSGVPGRMQLHTLKNGARAFVDYAHKSGAMRAVLQTLRKQTNHLIVVFGCGGEKDATKRPVMGEIAARYADLLILSNDNPRGEHPQAIIEQILAGIPEQKRGSVVVQLDRKKAIEYAANESCRGSVVALLGKGHESTIQIGDKVVVCDDYAHIARF